MSTGVILFWGILSAYNFAPTVGTLEYRQAMGQLPADVSMYDALLAVDDCSLIGHEARLVAGNEVFTAIIFDCASANGAWYFADGNVIYDEPWRMLAGEVGYGFWQAHPGIVRSMVMIEVSR